MLLLELNWPRGLNLDVLSEFLSEEELRTLILKNLEKSRLERRIVLPSAKCFKKAVCYYFGCQVEEGKMGWDEVMVKIKGNAKTLKELDITRRKVKLLYQQRKKEITELKNE